MSDEEPLVVYHHAPDGKLRKNEIAHWELARKHGFKRLSLEDAADHYKANGKAELPVLYCSLSALRKMVRDSRVCTNARIRFNGDGLWRSVDGEEDVIDNFLESDEAAANKAYGSSRGTQSFFALRATVIENCKSGCRCKAKAADPDDHLNSVVHISARVPFIGTIGKQYDEIEFFWIEGEEN